MNHRDVMLRCAQVNAGYMRLPAGTVDGYQKLVALYQRIADQSVDCAQVWAADLPCPDHEPAVDAFWWGVVSWAEAFGVSISTDAGEWEAVFVRPHEQFAGYLRPRSRSETLDPVVGSPAETVMGLDVTWMALVVKLTIQFGLTQNVKDYRAMVQAHKLGQELRRPDNPARRAYLQSDLVFFRQLFSNFSFSQGTAANLDRWLQDLEEEMASV